MVTPLIAGATLAAAAYAGRYGIQAWQAFKARPPSLRKFYEGGFQPKMTKREAALILGLRGYARLEHCIFKVKHDLPAKVAKVYVHLAGGSILATEFWESQGGAVDKVREAHRRVMVANHPDAGGSHYLASKVNEAKDVMLGKSKNTGSAF